MSTIFNTTQYSDGFTFGGFTNSDTYIINQTSTGIIGTAEDKQLSELEETLSKIDSGTMGAKFKKIIKDAVMSSTNIENTIEGLSERGIEHIWVSDQNLANMYNNPLSIISRAIDLSKFKTLVDRYNIYSLNEKILLDIFKEINNLTIVDVYNIYTHNAPEFDNIIILPKFDLRKKGVKEIKDQFMSKYKGHFIIDAQSMKYVSSYSIEYQKYIDMIVGDNHNKNVLYSAQYSGTVKLSASIDYVTDNYMFKSIFVHDLTDDGITKHLLKHRNHDIVPLIERLAPLSQREDEQRGHMEEEDFTTYANKELIIMAFDLNDPAIFRPFKVGPNLLVEARCSFNRNLDKLSKAVLADGTLDSAPINYIFD